MIWEYSRIAAPAVNRENALADYGRMGWELVAVTIPNGYAEIWFFKRPLAADMKVARDVAMENTPV